MRLYIKYEPGLVDFTGLCKYGSEVLHLLITSTCFTAPLSLILSLIIITWLSFTLVVSIKTVFQESQPFIDVSGLFRNLFSFWRVLQYIS